MLKLSQGNPNKRFAKIAEQKLMAQIPFTETELSMNDDGYFSEAQKLRLKPKIDLYIVLSGIGAFMGFVIASICFYAVQSFLITSLFIALFGICLFGVYWSLALAAQIKKGYGVRRVVGNVELWITYTGENDDIPNYVLKVRDVQFRLDKEIYDAFEPGEYRVYYFRLLRNELLSVEAVV